MVYWRSSGFLYISKRMPCPPKFDADPRRGKGGKHRPCLRRWALGGTAPPRPGVSRGGSEGGPGGFSPRRGHPDGSLFPAHLLNDPHSSSGVRNNDLIRRKPCRWMWRRQLPLPRAICCTCLRRRNGRLPFGRGLLRPCPDLLYLAVFLPQRIPFRTAGLPAGGNLSAGSPWRVLWPTAAPRQHRRDLSAGPSAWVVPHQRASGKLFLAFEKSPTGSFSRAETGRQIQAEHRAAALPEQGLSSPSPSSSAISFDRDQEKP